MHFRYLPHLLAAVGIVSAIPKPTPLNHDDVVLLRDDGSSLVVKDHQYQSIMKQHNLQPAPRSAAPPATPARSNTEPNKQRNKRCDTSTELQVLTDETFLNWDVAISPVVSAQGGSAQVSVGTGYSIANSISIGASTGLTIVKDLLQVSYSIDYSQSWTTSQSQTYSYTVPDGQFGVVVSQPRTRRIAGNYLSGCTDAPDAEAFSADSYTSQSYGNLNWVTGVVRLCNSTTYPVPYCIGTGNHS